jgi:hypothetical protein
MDNNDEYSFADSAFETAEEDYLTRCVADPVKRKFYLYSEQGAEKVLDCETVDQFMSVLELCRAVLDEDTLAYASPL